MTLRFLTFELDTDRRELRAFGRAVAVSPKVFDVLCYLIEHRDRMVSKGELLDQFWSANVSEAALQKAISQLRKALENDGVGPQRGHDIIKTHHGLGFRFVPEISQVETALEVPAPVLSVREQRFVAVLSVGVTAPGQSGDDEFGDETETLLKHARDMVETYQGTLIRMTLDGFMAAFGLSQLYEDGARRAIHCAVALRDAMPVSHALELRFGVNTGPVDVAAAGADWAPPSHIERGARNLEIAAASGEIMLSAATLAQLRDEIECTLVADGYRLLSIDEMQSGIPARPLKRMGRFVGRHAELAFLASSLSGLQRGSGHAVTLSGPAGIGKTRLMSEFLSSLQTQVADAQQIKLHCLPGLANSPGAMIRDMCLALFTTGVEVDFHDPVDVALLATLRDEESAQSPALKGLSEHQIRQRTRAVLDQLLTQACANSPMVLVFEDVHWMDATSRDMLADLIRAVPSKAVLVLLTTRPNEDQPLTDAVLQLPPLGRDDSLTLLLDDALSQSIQAPLAERLVQRAAGNPFFIEELALAAQSSPDPATDLPETVQAVISVRIGALSDEQRALLYVVAVIGPPAQVDLVAHVLGCSPEDAATRLDTLMRAGFVQIDINGYAFRHMLIHDTAYAMVAPRERKRLHGVIAAHLEASAVDWQIRPETLAWHHQQAGAIEPALGYWLKASRAALYRSAHHEAIGFSQSGLDLITQDLADADKRELDLLLCLAPALTTVRGYGADDVGAAYARARDLAAGQNDPKADIRILVGLWIHTWVAGRLGESLGHARQLLDLSDRLNDPALRLQAHASMGEVLLHKGQMAEALEHLEAGLDAIGSEPPTTIPAQNSAVACASYGAWACALMGRREDVQRYVQQSKQIAQVIENPFALAIHGALCSEPYMFLGDVEGCQACADAAITVSREHGFAFWLGTGLVMRGWVLGQQGDMAAALETFDEGINIFEATGAGVQLANWYGLKAETLLKAGQTDAALEAGYAALHMAARTDDMFFTPRIHSVVAAALVQKGDKTRAEDHLAKASELVQAFGMTAAITQL